MVRLRLRRVGRKGQASFRIVAADKESPRDGKFLEVVGFYNPRTEPETIQLKEDRIYYWLGVGAQPSDSVERIFKTAGTMDRFARLKGGEAEDKLLAEAEKAEADRVASPRTRYPAPEKSSKKVDEPAAAAPAAAAPVAEAAPAEEAVVEEAVVEETPAEEATDEAAE